MKVQFELIPKTAWGSNLRNGKVIWTSEWRQISKIVRENAGYKCAICGEYHPEPGGTDAHEVWEWDEETGTQKLKDIICICETCHLMMHPGQCAKEQPERLGEILKRFQEMNDFTDAQMETYGNKAMEEHKRRGQIQWKIEDGLAARVRKQYLNTMIF